MSRLLLVTDFGNNIDDDSVFEVSAVEVVPLEVIVDDLLAVLALL